MIKLQKNIKKTNWINIIKNNKFIMAKKTIPVAWNCEWEEFFSKDMISPEEKFLASNHHHFKDDPLSGIENLIASGFIYVFGELYNTTNDNNFLEASKKIIKNLS